MLRIAIHVCRKCLWDSMTQENGCDGVVPKAADVGCTSTVSASCEVPSDGKGSWEIQ